MPHVTGANNDIAKGVGFVETPQPVDGERLLLPVEDRRRSHLACRALHVLLAQRLGHIIRGDVESVHTIRTQPDAHAVVARAKQLDLPDARQACQGFAHLGAGVIADKQR
ncbi:hypothetical protein D3C72_714630 [compost metagenome]